jgi:sorting nexin-8
MTNTLNVVVEVNAPCWRGEQCELCTGVNMGIGRTASHCQRHADLLEGRVGTTNLDIGYCLMLRSQSRGLFYSTLESLKVPSLVSFMTRHT